MQGIKSLLMRAKHNWKPFFTCLVTLWSVISALLGLLLSFVSWEELQILRVRDRLLILLGLTILLLVVSMLWVLCQNFRQITGRKDCGVILEYGDVIKQAFSDRTHRRIVVIPVNRCFDLTTEENLVNPSTIHGQWLARAVPTERDRIQVQAQILQCLERQQAKHVHLTRRQKPHGNLERYAAGTVAELPGPNNVTFYLLALAEFNQDLTVNCSEPDFYQVVQSLIEYYRCRGQSVELYCPLMGDHIVEPARDSRDVLALMLSILRFNRQKIHGKIHVVVYDQRKDDISIASV